METVGLHLLMQHQQSTAESHPHGEGVHRAIILTIMLFVCKNSSHLCLSRQSCLISGSLDLRRKSYFNPCMIVMYLGGSVVWRVPSQPSVKALSSPCLQDPFSLGLLAAFGTFSMLHYHCCYTDSVNYCTFSVGAITQNWLLFQMWDYKIQYKIST